MADRRKPRRFPWTAGLRLFAPLVVASSFLTLASCEEECAHPSEGFSGGCCYDERECESDANGVEVSLESLCAGGRCAPTLAEALGPGCAHAPVGCGFVVVSSSLPAKLFTDAIYDRATGALVGARAYQFEFHTVVTDGCCGERFHAGTQPPSDCTAWTYGACE